jgi:hypothetical protein
MSAGNIVVVVIGIVAVIAFLAWIALRRNDPERAASHDGPPRTDSAELYGDVDDRPAGPGAEGDAVTRPGEPGPGPSAESGPGRVV